MATENLDFRNQFSFVCKLFQPDLWQEVRSNYDLIISYFMKSEMTKRVSIQIGILNYLNAVDPSLYNIDHFYSYLITQGGLIKEEGLELCKLVSAANSDPDKSSFVDVSKRLREIAYSMAAERAKNTAGDDPQKYVEELKKFEYHTSFSDKIQLQYLDQYTVNELEDEYLDPSKVLESAFPFINRASVLNGWPMGQVIAVTSPPGGGKTLFMMCECSHMAKKFLENGKGEQAVYVALADMNILDFYVRLYSTNFVVPFDVSTTKELNKAVEYGRSFGKSIAIIIEASNVLTMKQVVDYILEKMPKVRVVFADYDSQFASEGAKGSMYEDAVEPYIEASRLKKAGITTFIGCQPRIAYYGQEYLDLNALGESSKKQHAIDFMLSIGSNDEVMQPCGYIAMPKSRRMFNRFKVPYIRTNSGNMVEVPFSVYQKYRMLPYDPTMSNERLLSEITTSNSPAAGMASSMQLPDSQGSMRSASIPPIMNNSGTTILDLGTIGPGSGVPTIPQI